jgi:hypothetical protein
MGIINNDVYVCSNGVQKAGTYISFATETIYVVQNYSGMPMPMPGQGSVPTSGGYNVRANYRIFWDQECREAGKSFIDLKSVSATLTSEQLNSNIYAILYEELKKIYPNTSDELRAAPVVPAAPSAPVADQSINAPPSGPAASSDAAPADSSAPAASSDAVPADSSAPAASSDAAPADSSAPAASSDAAPADSSASSV